MTDLTTLFTGANPDLLYGSIALVAIGFIALLLVRVVTAAAVQGRVRGAQAKVAGDIAAEQQRPRRVVGRRVYPRPSPTSTGPGESTRPPARRSRRRGPPASSARAWESSAGSPWPPGWSAASCTSSSGTGWSRELEVHPALGLAAPRPAA